MLGPILGPLVGGAILTHLSWRFMFWVNVPFCVIGLVLAARYTPADAPRPGAPRPRLDLPGLALLTPGVAAIIIGLSNAGSSAGFAQVIWAAAVDPADVPMIRSASVTSSPAAYRPATTPISHALPADPPPWRTSARAPRG